MRSLQPAMIVALVLGSACTDGMNLASDAGPSDRGAVPDSSEEAAEVSTDGVAGDVPSWETGGPCPPTVTHGGSCSGEPDCVMPEPGCFPCEAGHYLLLSEYCVCRTSTASSGYWVCRPPDADCPYGDSAAYCDPDCTRPDGMCADGGTDGGDAGDPDASDGELPTCAGGWFDPTSGLCWQDPPDETARIWGDAVAYCDGLLLGGHDGWHLPTISELRSLARGCPSIETGGSCGVTDSSTDFAGWGYDRCGGCIPLGGPGIEGCFWSSALSGECGTYYSQTAVSGVPSVWGVDFYAGFVTCGPSGGWVRARCVRPGP